MSIDKSAVESVKTIEDLIETSGRAPMCQNAHDWKTLRVFDRPHGYAQPEITGYSKKKQAKRCAYIEARQEVSWMMS